jgi:hypothetical protein
VHRTDELQPSNLEASVAVMAVEMRYVRAGIEELKLGQQQNVSRREYEDFKDGIQKELTSRRLPWTSIGAFIVAAAGLLLVVVDRLAN